MRRFLSLTLTLLLLLAACAPAQPATSQAALSADEVARAVLAACGEDPEFQRDYRPYQSRPDWYACNDYELYLCI